ncbi:hypothetical protein FKM82_000413 [Ascaphus truei]
MCVGALGVGDWRGKTRVTRARRLLQRGRVGCGREALDNMHLLVGDRIRAMSQRLNIICVRTSLFILKVSSFMGRCLMAEDC